MACSKINGGLIDPSNLPQSCADSSTLGRVFFIAFVIIGALAVLMLVVAGFRYITSQGEPQKVAEVKRQIVYALVGLIIAASAAAIVNFALGGLQ